MKIFFCGQRSFGAAVLEELVKRGHEIVGVSPAPRSEKKDKVEIMALRKRLPVISDGERLSFEDIPEGTDLIVAAHAHWIISQRALEKARLGGIGFHPSLLPLHRGRDAVRWAVHTGDKVTGGSVYWLNDKCDGGDIIDQRLVFIRPGESYHDLWGRIFPVGVQMLCDAVDAIQAGAVESYPQEEACATWEPSFDRPRLKRNDLFRLGTAAGYTRVRCADCINYICDDDNYRCLCGLSVAAGKKLYVSDNDTCSRGERK